MVACSSVLATIATIAMDKVENVLATIAMDKDENAIQDTSVEEVGEVRFEGAEENNEGQLETVESNRAVVAINEDELERNKSEQEDETVILVYTMAMKVYVKMVKISKILMKVQQMY